MTPSTPCRECPGRYPGCHARCDRYAAFRRGRDAANLERQRDNDVLRYIRENHEKRVYVKNNHKKGRQGNGICVKHDADRRRAAAPVRCEERRTRTHLQTDGFLRKLPVNDCQPAADAPVYGKSAQRYVRRAGGFLPGTGAGKAKSRRAAGETDGIRAAAAGDGQAGIPAAGARRREGRKRVLEAQRQQRAGADAGDQLRGTHDLQVLRAKTLQESMEGK